MRTFILSAIFVALGFSQCTVGYDPLLRKLTCPPPGPGSSGSGIISLNGLNGATQTFTNDTNVTVSSSGTAHTFGWTGTLAAARLNANVVQSIVNDTNVTGTISAQALTIGWTGTLAGARGGTGNGFFAISGPASSLKTWTIPNQSINWTALSGIAKLTAGVPSAAVAGTDYQAPFMGTCALSGTTGAVTATDTGACNIFASTLTGNVTITLALLANKAYTFQLTQDATGGRTTTASAIVTLPSMITSSGTLNQFNCTSDTTATTCNVVGANNNGGLSPAPYGLALPATPSAGVVSTFEPTQKRYMLINDAGNTFGVVQDIAAIANRYVGSIVSGVPILAAQPGFSSLSGSATCAQLPALTGDTTTSAGACATTTVKINGTTVNTNAAADQVIVTTASATASWTSIANCVAAGGVLQYATASHAFSCHTIAKADLPSTTVSTDQVNTAGAAMTLDMSASTASNAFKVPVVAGGTVSANGGIIYDSTAQMLHAAQASADAFVPQSTATPANNDCVKWTASGSKYTLASAGAACGSGGSGGTAGAPLFVQTAATSAITGNSETTLIGSGVNSLTIPAAWFTAAGTVMDACTSGLITTGAVPGTVQFKLKLGGTVVGQSAAFTPLVSLTNASYQTCIRMTARTVGASGTVFVNTILPMTGATLTPGEAAFTNPTPGTPVTIDTTGTLLVDFTVTFQLAATNSITGHTFDLIGPGSAVSSVTIDGGSANTGAVSIVSKVTGVSVDGSASATGATSLGGEVTYTGNQTQAQTDCGKTIKMNGSSITLTLAATPVAKCRFKVLNINSSALTIGRNSLTINGASSNLTLVQYHWTDISTDGTNYFSSNSMGPGTGIAETSAATGNTLGIDSTVVTKAGNNTFTTGPDDFSAVVLKNGPSAPVTQNTDFLCDNVATIAGYVCGSSIGTTETYFTNVIATVATAATANTIDGTHAGLWFKTIFDVVGDNSPSFVWKLVACSALSGQTCTGRVVLWQNTGVAINTSSNAQSSIIDCAILATATATTHAVSCGFRSVNAATAGTNSAWVASIPNTSTNWVLVWSIQYGTATHTDLVAQLGTGKMWVY